MVTYTQSDFARRVGRSKQWISNKVLRHRKRWGTDKLMEFSSVEGEVVMVKLIRPEGGRKWMLGIVSTQG